MKQTLSLFSLLLVVLLAGCADTDTQPPRKKHAMVGTPDSQFTTDAALTNGVPPTDTNGLVTDTNNTATNSAATSPANPFPTPTPVPVAASSDLPYGCLLYTSIGDDCGSR